MVMDKEIDSAVQFICGLLRARSLSLDLVETFRTVLCEVMYGRYAGHWFPDKPCKGSAYRCMRINDQTIDPLILKAASQTGLPTAQLLKLLPSQLTVWVDPEEVAYRIGEDGSIGILYSSSAAVKSAGSNSDGEDLSSDLSCSSSESSSTKSSPSQSPVPSSTDDEAATMRHHQLSSLPLGGGGARAGVGMAPCSRQQSNAKSGGSRGSSSVMTAEQFVNNSVVVVAAASS